VGSTELPVAWVLSTGGAIAVKALQSLPARSRPVLVRASRFGNGRVIARAEYDVMGMIPADNLNP
jgi:hypothetical protein